MDTDMEQAMTDEPLFELHCKDGHKWAIYENGRAVGFPEGTVIVNKAKPLLDLLRGRIKQLPAPSVTDRQ